MRTKWVNEALNLFKEKISKLEDKRLQAQERRSTATTSGSGSGGSGVGVGGSGPSEQQPVTPLFPILYS